MKSGSPGEDQGGGIVEGGQQGVSEGETGANYMARMKYPERWAEAGKYYTHSHISI
jgi:hypothetical protein